MRVQAKIVKSRVYIPRQNACVVVKGRLLPWKEGVDLFNVGRKWWLHYGFSRNTGSFPSKKRAMEWYERGGR